MSEYPKVIDVDGLKITALDADDESRWRQPRVEPVIEPVIEAAPEPVVAPDAPVVPVKQARVTRKKKVH